VREGGKFLSGKLEEVRCSGCGASLTKEYYEKQKAGGLITCPYCKKTYMITQIVVIVPKLILEKEEGKTFEFKLNERVVIGREPEHNFVIMELSGGRFENTYIRNPYISKRHVEIEVAGEYVLEKTYVVKKGLLQDLGSRFGTAINGYPLRRNEKRALNHNDRITLAHESPMPITIIYKET